MKMKAFREKKNMFLFAGHGVFQVAPMILYIIYADEFYIFGAAVYHFYKNGNNFKLDSPAPPYMYSHTHTHKHTYWRLRRNLNEFKYENIKSKTQVYREYTETLGEVESGDSPNPLYYWEYGRMFSSSLFLHSWITLLFVSSSNYLVYITTYTINLSRV